MLQYGDTSILRYVDTAVDIAGANTILGETTMLQYGDTSILRYVDTAIDIAGAINKLCRVEELENLRVVLGYDAGTMDRPLLRYHVEICQRIDVVPNV